MRIALISQPWAKIFPPGDSISIWNHAVGRELATRGHEVVVYGSVHGGAPEVRTDAGVEYRFLSDRLDTRLRRAAERLARMRPPGRPAFASRLSYLAFALRVAADVRRHGFEVVHVHNLTQFVPAIRRAAPRARIVLHMSCEWLSTLERRMMLARARRADVIIGCSDYVTNRARAALPEVADRCRTVYNGVDVDRFTPAASGRDGADPTTRMISVGRISPEKGQHVLARAFNLVVERTPDVELELVGRESMAPREMLVDLYDDPRIAALSGFYGGSYLERVRGELTPAAASRVRMSGELAHAETAERYRHADLLVSPSLAEAFGLPLAEAMASGLPVVATTTGGMAEIVEDGVTGLSVEPDDPQALGDALARLASDRGLRRSMGEAARASAERRFAWPRVTDSLLEAYGAR